MWATSCLQRLQERGKFHGQSRNLSNVSITRKSVFELVKITRPDSPRLKFIFSHIQHYNDCSHFKAHGPIVHYHCSAGETYTYLKNNFESVKITLIYLMPLWGGIPQCLAWWEGGGVSLSLRSIFEPRKLRLLLLTLLLSVFTKSMAASAAIGRRLRPSRKGHAICEFLSPVRVWPALFGWDTYV